MVADYHTDARGHSERLAQAHRVRALMDGLQARAALLLRLYADADGERAAEIASLKGGNPFAAFYGRLAEVRAHHGARPDADVTLDGAGEAPPSVAPFSPEFSGEEAGGRCLDLHELHRALLQQGARFGLPEAGLDYKSFVQRLTALESIPPAGRRSAAWRDYVGSLVSYLESFFDRTQPLTSLAAVYAPLADFDARFDAGEVAGWADRGEGGAAAGTGGGAAAGAAAPPPPTDPGAPLALPAPTLDLAAFSSPAELEALGADALKGALAALGLKAGGAPAERAARLWLTRDTPLADLDRKHFAKGAAPPRRAADPAKARAASRATARLEARAGLLAASLAPALDETVAAIERKHARTHEEALADAEDADGADLPSDDDDDDRVHNPLALPLGFDGRPIPYWLYKLHGLNQEFRCEICGGASYWGRREFERHFRDARHAQGMRSLGIPNTKEFYEVVSIDDARSLWASLQARARAGGGAAPRDEVEEVEDADGNVYDRRTYEDLKKQGVL
jgi:splicing factor 3A subunit 3